MTDLHIPVKYCEGCGAKLEIRAHEPTMCGKKLGYWELYWVCPVFDCFIPPQGGWIHIKVE